MADPHTIRKVSDLEKLRRLQGRMPRTLQILEVSGDPPQLIKLRINIPTAGSPAFPRERQEINIVEIQLPQTYPLPPGPNVLFTTPIWNPNVFVSGKWCYGNWTITENLELFVLRLMQVIALDPTIIYPQSPANKPAADWYEHLRRHQPTLFPTVSVTQLLVEIEKPRITWRTIK